MLNIPVDPNYPLGALEACSCVVALLGDYVMHRRQDTDMPELAVVAFGELADAVCRAHERVADAMRGATGEAGASAEPTEARTPLNEAAELLTQAVAVIRAEATGKPPLPKLTEPRTAAQRRSRAA